MFDNLKRTEIDFGKKELTIESSFSGLFRETFILPRSSIDYIAVRNSVRVRESLLTAITAYLVAYFSSDLALLLAAFSVLLLLMVKPTKVLMTSGGTGIRLYLNEKDWEKLKRL